MQCSSGSGQTSGAVFFNDLPLKQDISFIRGDQVNRKFLWGGVVYTRERPVDTDGLPMYHPSEVPDTASPIPLVAPWEERFWHAEIRNGYMPTMRYYNGWIPWYGSQPRNWTWWLQTSLAGVFECTSEYSDTYKGTIVSIKLPSEQSVHILPLSSYNWDLESAHPIETDLDGNPTNYDTLKTWLHGKATVTADYTLLTPVGMPS